MMYLNPILFLRFKPIRQSEKAIIALWSLIFLSNLIITFFVLTGYLLRLAYDHSNLDSAISITFGIIAFLLSLWTFTNIILSKFYTRVSAKNWHIDFKSTFFRIIYYIILQSILAFATLSFFGKNNAKLSDVIFQSIDIILILLLFYSTQPFRLKETFAGKIKIRYFFGVILVALAIKIVSGIASIAVLGQKIIENGVKLQWKDIVGTSPKNSFEIFLVALSICLLGPIYEELVYRGILFNGLHKRMRFIFAALISSFVFMLMHSNNSFILVNAFIAGFFMALVYYKTKNLYYSITFHIAFNSLPFILLFLGQITRWF